MLGLGHDVVDVPAFAKQLNEPGTRMRNLFSMREIWQTAQRSQLKHDDEGGCTSPPAGQARRRS